MLTQSATNNYSLQTFTWWCLVFYKHSGWRCRWLNRNTIRYGQPVLNIYNTEEFCYISYNNCIRMNLLLVYYIFSIEVFTLYHSKSLVVISGHQGRQALSSSLSVATRGRPRSGGPTLWPSENLRASSLLWLIRSEGDRSTVFGRD